MRNLFAVLSLLAVVLLVVAVAVCGVVGLEVAPMEAGLTLAAVAPEFAECPMPGATVIDCELVRSCHYRTPLAGLAIALDDNTMEVLTLRCGIHAEGSLTPTLACTTCWRDVRLAATWNQAVRGPGDHAARG